MSFGIYIIGYIIFIVGLAIGAHMLHMPPRWIGVGVTILVGLGVITGVTSTEPRFIELMHRTIGRSRIYWITTHNAALGWDRRGWREKPEYTRPRTRPSPIRPWRAPWSKDRCGSGRRVEREADA